MISIEEALEKILALVSVLPPEVKPPLDALGQVLDEDISAEFDVPPLANSGMDGYAVRAEDTTEATEGNPRELRVVGEVAAGYVYGGSVAAGTAVRIMTGAPIPDGADAVVPFEETDEPFDSPPKQTGAVAATVRVFKAARPAANVRAAGEDIKAGARVLRRGAVLRPPEVAVLASLGKNSVRVIRRPRVAVLSTGDELLEPGEERTGAYIYDANAYGVAALISRFGGEPLLLGIAKDTIEDLTEKIHEGLAADLLVTSAGVSRGDYDVVKEVLAREGEVAFWTVAMKPGKPLAFGSFSHNGRRVPHLGLPGNPVSSLVAFEIFGRPAILKMMGKTDFRRPSVQAIAEERIANAGDPRAYMARCLVTERDGTYYVRLAGSQSSGALSSLARANGLTVIPAEVDAVEAGETVEVMMLDWTRGEDSGSSL